MFSLLESAQAISILTLNLVEVRGIETASGGLGESGIEQAKC
jgi:hypothetical protein